MKTPMKTLKTMLKLSLIAIAAPLSVARATPPPTATPAAPTSPAKTSGRVTLKGVDYHYEVRGQGDPLLLLHGGPGQRRHVRAAPADPGAGAPADHRRPAGPRALVAGQPADPLRGDRRRRRGAAQAPRPREGRRARLFVRRMRRAAAGRAAPGRRAPPRAGVDAVLGRRLVSGDARAAGAGLRGAVSDDEGDADVQVVRRGRARSPISSRACWTRWASPCGSRTIGRRTSPS